MSRTKKVRQSAGDKIFDLVAFILALFSLLIAIYPLYFVVIASFSDPGMVSRGDVILYPKGFTLEAYEYIFKTSEVWRGYKNTLVYVIGSVGAGLFITIPGAYALSRDDLVGRNFFTKLITFTMFFQGGLIPTYIMMRNFHLTNTPWVVIFLASTTVFNVIVARTFFISNMPKELWEAASADGCGNVRYFFMVVLPLSKTVIAIVALYVAVAQWNSFFNAMIYLTDEKYSPLQIILRKILIMGQNFGSAGEMDPLELEAARRISLLVKYALIVVSSGPIIALYPFLQKYFVKGVMVGSVKG
ncbi:MAG: carbohydrate ABC transporter permease [Lachnospiraceae bacterium]|jgi:putative aldouronate transport system permease protein|nr:carbohydrate ABC transporter permease [Lachnospiraceae bacterium]